METKELAPSIIESCTDFDIAQITPDVAEIALDHILDDGIVRDIPVVKSLYSIYKTTIALRDRALIKKILLFLSSLKSVSKEEQKRFKERINQDTKFKQKVGEHLLLILERLDDMGKPHLVGNVFRAYIEQVIHYETFKFLSFTIDRSFFSDLISFKESNNYNRIPAETKISLVNSGLLEVAALPGIRMKNQRGQPLTLDKL